jgi:hypothetical protein
MRTIDLFTALVRQVSKSHRSDVRGTSICHPLGLLHYRAKLSPMMVDVAVTRIS